MKAFISIVLAIVTLVGAFVLQGCGQDPTAKSTAQEHLRRGLSAVESASYPSVEGLASGSKEAQDRQRQSVEATGLPLEVNCQKTGMRLRLIPAGEFVMGSPGDESGRFSNEGPQRTVRITKPFYMGIHEVTQAQCQAVMGSNPSHLKGNDLPVECVSWNDAMEFCRRLSEQTGLTFGLPTEAQWEYACRAGATTTYCFSGNAAQLKDYAWYLDDSGRKTHPVGQKRPNAFGLYDMHGNVLEWCLDSYKDRYTRLPNRDPQYEQQGATHVLRGGSYDLTEGHCRSAYRDSQNPVVAYLSSGFRVVVVLQGKAKPDKQTSWDKGMSSITQKSYEKRRI